MSQLADTRHLLKEEEVLSKMDNFNPYSLRRFVQYAINNDVQITANRRQARQMFVESMDDDGAFQMSAEKAEKILTFLSLNDNQVHGSGHEGTVSIYAFIRLVGEIRRNMRIQGMGTGTTTPAGSHGASPGGAPVARSSQPGGIGEGQFAGFSPGTVQRLVEQGFGTGAAISSAAAPVNPADTVNPERRGGI